MKKKQMLAKLLLLGLFLGTNFQAGTVYANNEIDQNGGAQTYTFTTDDTIASTTGDAIRFTNGAQSIFNVTQGTNPYLSIQAENGIGIHAYKLFAPGSTLEVNGPVGIVAQQGIVNDDWNSTIRFHDVVNVTAESIGVYNRGVNGQNAMSFDDNVFIKVNAQDQKAQGILNSNTGKMELAGEVRIDLQGNKEAVGIENGGSLAAGTMHFSENVSIAANAEGDVTGILSHAGNVAFDKNIQMNLHAYGPGSYGGAQVFGIWNSGQVDSEMNFHGNIDLNLSVNGEGGSVTGKGIYMVSTNGMKNRTDSVFEGDVRIKMNAENFSGATITGMSIYDTKNSVDFKGAVDVGISIDDSDMFEADAIRIGPTSGARFYDDVHVRFDVNGSLDGTTGINNMSSDTVFYKNVIIESCDEALFSMQASSNVPNLIINPNKESSVLVQMTGDIIAQQGNITVNLNNVDSFINGDIIDKSNGIATGVVNISLGNGATWSPKSTGTMNLSNITLNQGGIIDFTKNGNLTRAYSPRTLTIGDLSGNGGGIFKLNTDLANGIGDHLSFSGNVPGEKYYVQIKDVSMTDGNTIAAGSSGTLTIATAANGAGTGFALEAQPVAQNGYYYQPQLTTVTNGNELKWNLSEITGNGVAIDAVRPETGLDYIDTVLPGEFDEETYKRLNDLRTDPSEVGVWLRGERGKVKISGIQYDYNVTVGGYDWARVEDDRNLFAGISIGRAKSMSDLGIIGDTSSTSYSLYGSYFGKERKDYFDVIFKYGDLDKDYAGYDLYKNYVTGKYDKHYVSLAMKYGRRIEQEGGWYWEPSVGATWGRIGDATFTDSQGTRIHSDRIESKVLEAGVQFGRQVAGMDYYIKGTLAHDFDGKIRMSAPGAALEDDQGGTWFKLLLGASRKVNNRSSLYLDIGHDFGNKVKKPWSLSGGYRFSW